MYEENFKNKCGMMAKKNNNKVNLMRQTKKIIMKLTTNKMYLTFEWLLFCFVVTNNE